MANQVVELEQASQVLLASPTLVSSEQRHAAEAIFLNFRKTKNPYALCRHILETSTVDYVLFEAAGVLKDAIIREWSLMQDDDIKSLRVYLLQYVMHKPVARFVQERILQVIAIMVKRGYIEDFGPEQDEILSEVEQLILNGNYSQQILGCNLISAIMQEYATTVKSSDVGLTWELHYIAKKQFQVNGLSRISRFCVQALNQVTSMNPPFSAEAANLLKHLLSITEGVLTWGYISARMPKGLVGIFESINEVENPPMLRLNTPWRQILLEPSVISLFFTVHWKVRENPELAHHTTSCLVQLASVGTTVFNSQESQTQYFVAYMRSFLNFITSVNILEREALGISNIIRKLLMSFQASFVMELPVDLRQSFLNQLTDLTCRFAEGATVEESTCVEDRFYMEAFDHMLEAWITVLKDSALYPEDYCSRSSIRIFNTFLKCHLSPPDGTRRQLVHERRNCLVVNSVPCHSQDPNSVCQFNNIEICRRWCSMDQELDSEEIDEIEEDDRTRFKDQLQIIGSFGRQVLSHSLPLLARLLEERIYRLRGHLETMHVQTLNISNTSALNNLLEDIHWLILIAGHTIALDSPGETPLIPSEVMYYSIEQGKSGHMDMNTTLKVLGSPGLQIQEIPGALESADHVVRVISAVFRLCEVQSFAVKAKMCHMLSPELGCTMMWFLHRLSLCYLLPNESYYLEMSLALLTAFGKDSEGGTWTLNFLMNVVEQNLQVFTSEPSLIKDTVVLLLALVDGKEKNRCVLKTKSFWNILQNHVSAEKRFLPQDAKRGLFTAFVMTGEALDDTNRSEYWMQVLKPLQERFKGVICQENFNNIFHEEHVKLELIDLLESFIGVARGSLSQTVQSLFQFLHPVLCEFSTLVSVYRNYRQIVELILELYSECARCMLCYLPQEETRRIYESCLQTIQAYARCNTGHVSQESSAEEENYRDILLLMDLLTNLLSKDCIDLSPNDSVNDIENTVTASEVCLYGLNIIMPLMTVDLLKFPSLYMKYFKLITFVCEIYPLKVCSLPVDLLKMLLGSVEMGITQFGQDVLILCFNFLRVLAKCVFNSNLQNTPVYEQLRPFLKLIMDRLLTQRVNSDVLTDTSETLYQLICCYQDDYKEYVGNLLMQQENQVVAERLAKAFTKLTEGVILNTQPEHKMVFRGKFERFIVNVQGLLLVK